MKRFLFTVALVLWAAQAGATIRFVSPSGGGSTCSTGVPCSVSTALAATTAGDTVRFKSGTYTTAIDLSAVTNGTSYSNAVTFDTESGAGTVEIRPNNGTNVLLIGGARAYFIINDLIIDGRNITSNGGSNIRVTSGANHIRFSNVESRNNTMSTPAFYPGAGVLIEGDDVEWLGGSSHDNGMTSVAYFFTGAQAPYGFYWHGLRGILRGALVYNNGGYGIHAYDGTGSAPVNDLEISGNTIYSNGSHYFNDAGANLNESAGILAASGQRYQIFNNLVRSGTRQGGIAISLGGACNSGGCAVYNNTVYGMAKGGISISSGVGVVVKNNISSTNASSSGTNIEDSASGTTFSNNLCSTSGGTTNCSFSEAASTTFANVLSDWSLKAGSAAINGAAPSCPPPTTDILGVTRPQNTICDIGAYESSSPSPAIIVLTGPTTLDRYLTAFSTTALTGTATCPSGSPSITWTQSVAGSTINSGSASGTTSWSVSSGTAIFTADRINTFVFTNTCSSGSVSTTLYIGRNSTSTQVLMLPLNEGAGTTPQDISGSANHAVFAGSGTAWVTGKYGNGLRFNGSGWLEISDSDTLDVFAFSIGMWVNLDSVGAVFQTLLQKENLTPAFYGTVAGYCGDGRAAIFVYTTAYYSACSSVLTPSQWHYIAATFDMFTLKLYVDGALVDTNSLVSGIITTSTGKVRIANSQYSELLAGVIDEVRVIRIAIPLNNGTGDGCSDPIESVTKWMNCAMGSPPPGSPTRLTIGVDASIKFGANASLMFGAQ